MMKPRSNKSATKEEISKRTTEVTPHVLTINGGSSSIKFAFFSVAETPQRLLEGKVDRIGSGKTNLTFRDPERRQDERLDLEAENYAAAADSLIDWLEQQADFTRVEAVGHRVVHGMQHAEPQRVTPDLIEQLRRIVPYDPDHLPPELDLIEAFQQRHPKLPQTACFDTAFHRSMPAVARRLAIPRRFDEAGVQRYGFHGLSYAYLVEELGRQAGAESARGKVILAHLGNGASMAAVSNGRSVDTSMGFTPAGGLPMSTRAGDLDPGVAWFLMQKERLGASQFNDLINHQSGLLGVSETSSDMRDLLERRENDPRAAEAVDLFCYQARKWIGAFAAALGGVETLVFSGGIGENSPEIRRGICRGLQFFGIELDKSANDANAAVISAESGRVTVRVIPTDEQLMIARALVANLQEPTQD